MPDSTSVAQKPSPTRAPAAPSPAAEPKAAPAKPTGGTRPAGMSDLDHEGIRQLFARYSQTLDLGDADGFASCFVEDGVLDTSAPEPELNGTHRGREALRRYVRASTEYTAGRVRQSALNPLVDGDGDTARATSYVVVTRAHADATKPHLKPSPVTRSVLTTTGLFVDELVKSDDGWLFVQRTFRHDGLPEVLDRVERPITAGPRPDGPPAR